MYLSIRKWMRRNCIHALQRHYHTTEAQAYGLADDRRCQGTRLVLPHRRALSGQRDVCCRARSKLAQIWNSRPKNSPGLATAAFDSPIDHSPLPQACSLPVSIYLKMASKTFARTALRASKQKVAAPAVPKRSFISTPAARPAVSRATRAIAAPIQQQTRGVKTVDFAGHKEQVFGSCPRAL